MSISESWWAFRCPPEGFFRKRASIYYPPNQANFWRFFLKTCLMLTQITLKCTFFCHFSISLWQNGSFFKKNYNLALCKSVTKDMQSSVWSLVRACVPQGSILVPLFSLLLWMVFILVSPQLQNSSKIILIFNIYIYIYIYIYVYIYIYIYICIYGFRG